MRYITILLLFVGNMALAQTASVSGKVLGNDHQPLPGVTVTLEWAGLQRTVYTRDEGKYEFSDVKPGVYTFTFSLQGFIEVRQENVRVGAGQFIDLDITLKFNKQQEVVIDGDSAII